MTTKYVDHGAYGAAVFDGYISNTANSDNGVAGTWLTVTAVTSGFLNLGSHIGAPAGEVGAYVISALGTGTGGAGTYVVTGYPSSTIAPNTFLRATTGIVARYARPLATPVWGAPQDGDGLSQTPSSAAATVDIDLSTATAAAGAVISIMGASLTCVASAAGVNQFNAGSGATLVANLVTAINRTTNTSILTSQAGGWGTPKIQNAVFARIGSPTTTLQIMTRVGSAQYNSSLVTTSGFTGGTFGPYTFAGGISGCFGWLINSTGTIWPSALGTHTYGVLFPSSLIGGAVAPGDWVHVRSDKRLMMTDLTWNNPTIANIGSITAPVIYDIDDGTQWPEDGSTPVLMLTGPGNFGLNATHTTWYVLCGKDYNGAKNLVFVATNYGLFPYIQPSFARFENIELRNISGNGIGSISGGNLYAANQKCVCLGLLMTGVNSQHVPIGVGGSTRNVELIDCVVRLSAQIAPVNAVVSTASTAVALRLTSCKFEGFVEGSRLIAANGTLSTGYASIIAVNCNWGGITVMGPNYLTTAVTEGGTDMVAGGNGLYTWSTTGQREWTYERAGRVFADWTAAASRPTLYALLPDGITPWSVFATTTNNAGVLTPLSPAELPPINKVLPEQADLPAGPRTLILNFLVESTLSYTKASISFNVVYITTAGVVRTLTSRSLTGEALEDASSAPWSSTSWNGQTWVPYKITFVTPDSVAAGSELMITPCMHGSMANNAKGVIFDYEVQVS